MADTKLVPALDDRQRKFVRALLSGKSVTDSEAIAGYAATDGYQALDAPSVMAAIESALNRKLRVHAAPLAIRTLISLVESGSERAKLDAAKILLDRAGYVPPAKAADNGTGEKQLSEMTQDELHDAMEKSAAQVERMEAELAARAAQVNASNAGDTVPEPNSFLD